MNCDKYVDQTDLFSFFKDVKNDAPFDSGAFEDIKCINQ